MISHLKRFGWPYTVCLVVIVWPVILYRLQQVPPLDIDTCMKIAEWTDAQVERRIGKPIPDKYEAFFAKFQRSPIRDNPYVNGEMYLGVWTPTLAPGLDEIAKRMTPLLDEWDQLARQGVDYVPRAPIFRRLLANPSDRPALTKQIEDADLHVPDLLFVQESARLRRTIVSKACGERDWKGALDQLDKTAHSGDPVRASSGIGYLIAVAARSIAYSGYKELLASDPPAKVFRSALEALTQLRSTDPQFDPLTIAVGQRRTLDMLMLSRFFGTKRKADSNNPPETALSQDYYNGFALLAGVERAIALSGQFRDPSLRAWVKRFAHFVCHQTAKDAEFTIFQKELWRWTDIPSAVRFLKKATANEPVLLEGLPYGEDLLAKGDPWTLALSFQYFNLHPQESATRGRVTRTIGRLAEVAFAARLYRAEHSDWPSRIEDLIPTYMPPIPATESSPSNELPWESGAYLPLKMGWRETSGSLASCLWPHELTRPWESAKDFQKGPHEAYLTSGVLRRELDVFTWPRDAASRGDTAILTVAAAEALAAHAKIAEDVKAWFKPGQLSNWQPLDSDEARRIATEAKERPQGRAIPPELPQFRLTAHLRAPDMVFAIWSPGPDGMDDGASMVYDPTNGTVSRGDMVVFPEGY